MFCKNCGKEISDNAVVCLHCGVQVNPMQQRQTSQGENAVAIVGFIFSFLIPLVGLICSIVGYKKSVNHGAPCGGLAIAGIVLSVVFMIINLIIVIIYGGAILALFSFMK